MVRKKTRLMTAAAALLAVLAALLVAIPLMSTKSAAENVFEFVTGINDDGSLIKESKPYIYLSAPPQISRKSTKVKIPSRETMSSRVISFFRQTGSL